MQWPACGSPTPPPSRRGTNLVSLDPENWNPGIGCGVLGSLNPSKNPRLLLQGHQPPVAGPRQLELGLPAVGCGRCEPGRRRRRLPWLPRPRRRGARRQRGRRVALLQHDLLPAPRPAGGAARPLLPVEHPRRARAGVRPRCAAGRRALGTRACPRARPDADCSALEALGEVYGASGLGCRFKGFRGVWLGWWVHPNAC
jgi:hypothetical protein